MALSGGRFLRRKPYHLLCKAVHWHSLKLYPHFILHLGARRRRENPDVMPELPKSVGGLSYVYRSALCPRDGHTKVKAQIGEPQLATNPSTLQLRPAHHDASNCLQLRLRMHAPLPSACLLFVPIRRLRAEQLSHPCDLP